MAWSEFFTMGGYGVYVWPAFGLSAILLALVLGVSWRFLTVQQQRLERLEATDHELPQEKSRET